MRQDESRAGAGGVLSAARQPLVSARPTRHTRPARTTREGNTKINTQLTLFNAVVIGYPREARARPDKELLHSGNWNPLLDYLFKLPTIYQGKSKI